MVMSEAVQDKSNTVPGLDYDEETYNESEDEDFDPTKAESDALKKDQNTAGDNQEAGSSENDNEDDDEDYEAELEEEDKKYEQIVSESGGLIKTRRARLDEEQAALKNKYESLNVAESSDKSIALWSQLKEKALNRATFNGSVMDQDASSITDSMQEEKILIERTYKFAGETITEKKWVLRHSAAGQEYLNSTVFKTDPSNRKPVPPSINTKQAQKHSKNEQKSETVNEAGFSLRKHLKRPPILEQIIAGSLKPKLTTLEKSQLDWATYVDKEGIHDELNLHNKDGYLAKQDFLNRVESSKDEKYREFRKKQLQTEQQQRS